MENRFRLEIAYDRAIRAWEYGPQAIYYQTIGKEYSYGKNGIFKTSNEGIKKLTEWAKSNKDMFSTISIYKWNGYGGTGVYNERINNKFDNEIKGFEFPSFEEDLNGEKENHR